MELASCEVMPHYLHMTTTKQISPAITTRCAYELQELTDAGWAAIGVYRNRKLANDMLDMWSAMKVCRIVRLK